MTGNDLHSIITNVGSGEKKIEELKKFLSSSDNKEITVDQAVFELAFKQQHNTKQAIIHTILLHCVQSPDKQSLKEVVGYLEKAIASRIYAKNNPIKNPNEEFRTLINFQDDKVETLLHHAVIGSHADSITTLLEYGANPLIQNEKSKIPLDLAIDNKDTKNVLIIIKRMRKQASLYKDSAQEDAMIWGLFGAVIGIGISGGICAGVGASIGVALGIIITSALVVGIAIGLAVYFLSQDRKQAREIEKVLPQENKIGSVTPAAGTAGVQP